MCNPASFTPVRATLTKRWHAHSYCQLVPLSNGASRHPKRRVCWILALTVLPAIWLLAALMQCMHCYRLGNFLDFYFQRELLHGMASRFPNADATMPTRHTTALWRGVTVQRILQLRWWAPRSLMEQLNSVPLRHWPPDSFWEQPEPIRLIRTLIKEAPTSKTFGTSSSDFFLWWQPSFLPVLLPYVRSCIRSLIDSMRAVNPPSQVEDGTCVVHFRVGDFTNEMAGGGWKESDVRKAINAMVAAATTFPVPIRRFEVLGGGLNHGCNPRFDDCGVSTLDRVSKILRHTFTNASIVELRHGSPDEDFIRMVDAPMLLLGSVGTDVKVASSYSVYAATASNGHVRLPACFLRFGPCMGNLSVAPGWLAYRHPNCASCWQALKGHSMERQLRQSRRRRHKRRGLRDK